METPIARIARRFVLLNQRPSNCNYCGIPVGADEGVWRKTERELTCGSNECETRSQALQSW